MSSISLYLYFAPRYAKTYDNLCVKIGNWYDPLLLLYKEKEERGQEKNYCSKITRK